MYRAKHQEKGGVVFFDSDMAKTATARMESEQRLRLAVEDRKFCCAFQPKVDIHTQKVVGFETLVRWIDDSGGIHPPSEFIAVANETGLIDQITWHVIDEAASSLERLDREFGSDTSIAINLAARQANNSSFMLDIASRLKDTQLADRFILELTEEAFISGSDFQKTVLPRLRDLGVRVSIDDFGVGYSSLGSLADLTADEVKIDRSFIESIHTRPRSQTVLRAIESLCRTLGMNIVAEGVENSDELAYLMGATRIRCVQGFYFARPFFIEDLQTAAPAINRPVRQPRELFVAPRPELVRAR
jgi:EAL domain-containing protein (putative c-di-GMP-specific phosphodiesterase class I)